jgi:hypothetical protein
MLLHLNILDIFTFDATFNSRFPFMVLGKSSHWTTYTSRESVDTCWGVIHPEQRLRFRRRLLPFYQVTNRAIGFALEHASFHYDFQGKSTKLCGGIRITWLALGLPFSVGCHSVTNWGWVRATYRDTTPKTSPFWNTAVKATFMPASTNPKL